MRALCILWFVLLSTPVRACDIALLLALDVSGSVDPSEYRIQRDGLAFALNDSVVAEALVRANAQVSVMQWTGSGRQRVTIPWTSVRSFDDVANLALRVSRDRRVWRNFSTAVGEALEVGLGTFRQVPQCTRRVMDVSGDGVSNEGIDPVRIKPLLRAENVTVNAIAIEGAEQDLTGWYWENVITGEGAFVETASSFKDYPDRIRQKLIREIVPQFSKANPGMRFENYVITRFAPVITNP